MKKIGSIPEVINALILRDVNDLVYEKVDNYELKKDCVLVKIKNCGICSSDIERIFLTGTYHFPTIPGHEMSGQIVCVNDEDEKLLGKKTCIFPLLPCFNCDACLNEEYAQCSNYNYFGSRCDGGYSEYLLVPKWNLVLFDDSLDYKVAALCEPAAVGLHAINIGGIKKGDNVAISGTGTIAMLIALFAKSKNANVYMIGRNDNSLFLPKELGIDTIKSSEIDEFLARNFDGKGFSKVFEVVGSNDSINQSIKLAGNFGVVVMVGNPKDDIKLEKNIYWRILRKQIVVKGTWNSNYNDKINDWDEALKLMTNSDIPFDKLISREYYMSDYREAFEYLLDKGQKKMKVMFKND